LLIAVLIRAWLEPPVETLLIRGTIHGINHRVAALVADTSPPSAATIRANFACPVSAASPSAMRLNSSSLPLAACVAGSDSFSVTSTPPLAIIAQCFRRSSSRRWRRVPRCSQTLRD
jgi:hypothetical protein